MLNKLLVEPTSVVIHGTRLAHCCNVGCRISAADAKITPRPPDIAAGVMALIREQYDLNEVTPASLLKNIHGHALDLFLIIAIEDRFGIEITDEEEERVRTVADLIAVVLDGESPRRTHSTRRRCA